MSVFGVIEDGKVSNVILWDGKTPYETTGELIELPMDVGIDWLYDTGLFTPPPDRVPFGELWIEVDKRTIQADGKDNATIRVMGAEFPQEFTAYITLNELHYADVVLDAGFNWQIALSHNAPGIFSVNIGGVELHIGVKNE